MSKPKLLDLFCGVGGCSVGYKRAGFEVVGVDIVHQPDYPFEFIKADALTFPTSGFDAVHASPPCQQHSVTRSIHGIEYPDLVPMTISKLNACKLPWAIENVPGCHWLSTSVMLCGTMFGLGVYRHRWFRLSLGTGKSELTRAALYKRLTPKHPKHPKGNTTIDDTSGYSTGVGGFVTVCGNNFVRQAAASAMGVYWTKSRKSIAQSIPPKYTEYIGNILMREVTGEGNG